MTFYILNRLQKTPIAWRNLFHVQARLWVATGGIGFATMLIFMQLGFFGAVLKTATLVYDHLNFDLLIIPQKAVDATVTQTFERKRLYQAGGVNGVKSIKPFYVGFKQWRNPTTKLTRAILVMGFNPKDDVFLIPEIKDNLSIIQRQDTVLFDRLSRSEFGASTIGLKTELGGRRQTLGGIFTMGPSLRFDGAVIVSDQNFIRIFAGRSVDDVSLGLIKLKPGADIKVVQEELRQTLPSNLKVLTRREAEARDQKYWVTSTSVGYIFGIGAVMGFIVGMVIVYQILYTDISDHLSEYATLKAIGYSNFELSLIILQQAILLAILAYIPSFFVALGLYKITFIATNLPIQMTLTRAVFVFCATGVMCISSGLISLRKVIEASPGDLF